MIPTLMFFASLIVFQIKSSDHPDNEALREDKSRVFKF